MVDINKLGAFGEGRKRKRLEEYVRLVGSFEPEIEELTDADFPLRTKELQRRVQSGEESLDDVLPEAYAMVREAAMRSIGQRHFDVQVMGATVLHQGNIAEMRTGEGKTLVSTMPAYLNALAGKGVHVVTVNDYLAKRDSEWMGPIFRMLGVSVGLIQSNMLPHQRQPAYAGDLTYGTNNEFGFDYLRDNMAMRHEDFVQRGHFFAIVDEVDSILIDEARTPLIISGMIADSAKWYVTFARMVPRLKRDTDYEIDEQKRTVAVMEAGIDKVERELGIENLYEQLNTPLVHHLQNALRAKELYKRDVDYIVQQGEVKIVDEFTGRILEGRRYSEGLHQAIEAKENVRIKEENQTLATITIQNYFRMYEKLAGMTGTARTQAKEFEEVYKLSVVEIPTNAAMVRKDDQDLIYKTEQAKWNAVTEDIAERHEQGQPILVGTVSIEKSELLSGYLNRRGIPHHVLNAKQHEREAMIVAQAGRVGSVTVATNMAGRGVDILLGGNAESLARQEMTANDWDNDRYLLFEMEPDERAEYEAVYRPIYERYKTAADAEHEEVVESGGLYVLGTERHESRRIDNQLRGRAGRQGDPGASKFYLSLGDDLMRLFASDRIERIMERLKWPEDEPIAAKMVSKAIQTAQNNVEERNFEIRKNVLKYDEVMNTQRQVIYEERQKILEGRDLKDEAVQMVTEVVSNAVAQCVNREIFPEEWDLPTLVTTLQATYPTALTVEEIKELGDADLISATVVEDALAAYERKEEELAVDQQTGVTIMRELERMVLLSILDNAWREHLYEMDYLQEGIGLRAYGQRDPLVEYQREAFDMFGEMKDAIRDEFVRYIYRVELVREQPRQRAPRTLTNQSEDDGTGQAALPSSSGDKIPRNAPCPCGSGKKYKKCHGAEV
ncbi:MAG TPA: preprotein translocase subunit SecA [Actinobacteria bacterium]|nr:preprotein translocase subunit SecA [Actinomycetota bacterium]